MKIKLSLIFLVTCFSIPNFISAQYIQQGSKLVGTGAIGNSMEQGFSVAISADGNTAVVGGPADDYGVGAIWIFVRTGEVWSQQGQKLIGSDTVGHALQGQSVGISSDGNTVIFGGYRDNGYIGAIWVFTRSGSIWSQQGPKLIGTGATSVGSQGFSIAISSNGNTLIEGGYEDNTYNGAVWVFTRSGSVWTQQGPKLTASGLQEAFAGFSVAISSDGNTAVMGGPQAYFQEDNNNTVYDTTGGIWVFVRNGGVWTQEGPILIGTGAVGVAYQGISVAISADGNTIMEGGHFDNYYTGAAWVFTRSGGIWTQQGSKLVGSGFFEYPYQGRSVALTSNGNIAIVGGYWDNFHKGALWVFSRNGGVWSQQGPKLIGTDGIDAAQGCSVAITPDGRTFIEGGRRDNYEIGAAWVFVNPSIGIQSISNEIPKAFSLSQNYPNPFNPGTKIRFEIPGSSVAQTFLSVYNALGQQITTLVNEQLKHGTYEVEFNAADNPSGVYFYKLVVSDNTNNGGFSETKKMVLLK